MLGDRYPATCRLQESTDLGWVTTTLPLADSRNPLTLVGWPLPCHLRIPGIHWPWLGDHYPATCRLQESTDLGWVTTTLPLTDYSNPLTLVGWPLPWHLWIPGIHWPWLDDRYPATCRLQESTDLGWVTTTLPLADSRNPLTFVGYWPWLGDHYPATCRLQESTDLGWVTTTLPLADSRNPFTLVGYWPWLGDSPLPCHLWIPGIHWPWLGDHYPATCRLQESTDLGWVAATLPLADSRNPLTLVGWPLPCHLQTPGIHWPWLGDRHPATCGFQVSNQSRSSVPVQVKWSWRQHLDMNDRLLKSLLKLQNTII